MICVYLCLIKSIVPLSKAIGHAHVPPVGRRVQLTDQNCFNIPATLTHRYISSYML